MTMTRKDRRHSQIPTDQQRRKDDAPTDKLDLVVRALIVVIAILALIAIVTGLYAAGWVG